MTDAICPDLTVQNYSEIPVGFSGTFYVTSTNVFQFRKNGELHRKDGPAYVENCGYKEWWLDGNYIWNSNKKLDLTNQIVLSKHQHPEYPTIQVWKILNKNKVYEQIIIPGMEEFIAE